MASLGRKHDPKLETIRSLGRVTSLLSPNLPDAGYEGLGVWTSSPDQNKRAATTSPAQEGVNDAEHKTTLQDVGFGGYSSSDEDPVGTLGGHPVDQNLHSCDQQLRKGRNDDDFGSDASAASTGTGAVSYF